MPPTTLYSAEQKKKKKDLGLHISEDTFIADACGLQYM